MRERHIFRGVWINQPNRIFKNTKAKKIHIAITLQKCMGECHIFRGVWINPIRLHGWKTAPRGTHQGIKNKSEAKLIYDI